MREIRPSGSEGGETAIKAVFPTPIIGLWRAKIYGGTALDLDCEKWYKTVLATCCPLGVAKRRYGVGNRETNRRRD